MKSLLIGIIAFVSAASFGQVAGSAANWEVFTSWDFADTNLLSAPQGQHIGNPASGYINRLVKSCSGWFDNARI